MCQEEAFLKGYVKIVESDWTPHLLGLSMKGFLGEREQKGFFYFLNGIRHTHTRL